MYGTVYEYVSGRFSGGSGGGGAGGPLSTRGEGQWLFVRWSPSLFLLSCPGTRSVVDNVMTELFLTSLPRLIQPARTIESVDKHSSLTIKCYMYIGVCICIHAYASICILREREREKEREREREREEQLIIVKFSPDSRPLTTPAGITYSLAWIIRMWAR